MKMKRGEMIGFNGCLGYDYHPEDKSITVNEDEAEIVKFIFDMYLQGYGTTTIAKRLIELGKKNKKGEISWHSCSTDCRHYHDYHHGHFSSKAEWTNSLDIYT